MISDIVSDKLKILASNLIERDDMKERKISLKEVIISKSPKPFVRVFLDKEGGVGVSDLEYFHREFEALLDAEDYIKTRYILEVSSPGEKR